MLDSGQCAIDVADERSRSLAEIGELMGMTRQGAEQALKRAMFKFVRNARWLGLHDLVEHFRGLRGGLMDIYDNVTLTER